MTVKPNGNPGGDAPEDSKPARERYDTAVLLAGEKIDPAGWDWFRKKVEEAFAEARKVGGKVRRNTESLS